MKNSGRGLKQIESSNPPLLSHFFSCSHFRLLARERISIMHVKYVNDAFAAAKANAKALGNEFSGTKYDYYNHPHNADGVRINDL